MRSIFSLVLLVMLAFAFVQQSNAGRYWLRIGPAYRGGVEVSADGQSYVQQEGLTAVQEISRLPLQDVGSLGGYANRTYDNGYVRIDDITASGAAGVPPGFTGYYGYQNAAQYNGSSLTFTRSGGSRIERVAVESVNFFAEEDLDGAGAAISAGRILYEGQRGRIHLFTGLRVFKLSKDFDGSTYQETFQGNNMTIVDTYNRHSINGFPVYIPPAPHSGSYASGNVGVRNIPDSRSIIQSGQMEWTAANHVMMELDSMIYDVRIGAQFELMPFRRLTFWLSPAFMMTYLDYEVSRDEVFSERLSDGTSRLVGQWSDLVSGSEWLAGASLEAGLSLQLMRRLYFDLSGSYDWVANEAEISVGPNRLLIDSTGYTGTAGLRYMFGYGL